MQQMRGRLVDLRGRESLTADEQLEMFKLIGTVEPQVDLRQPLADFNAAHASFPIPLGLFLEGCTRLDKDDAAGLALLEQAMALDAEATKSACERAYTFLRERKETEAAEKYAQRWRERDAADTLRAQRLQHLSPEDPLTEHGAPAEVVAGIRARLEDPKTRRHIAQLYLARRVIPADPGLVQLVLLVRLTRWAEFVSRGKAVVVRLASMEWPVAVTVVAMEQQFKPWRKKVRALPGARLI